MLGLVTGGQAWLINRVALTRAQSEELARVASKVGLLRVNLENSVLSNLLLLRGLGTYVQVNPELSNAEFQEFARNMFLQDNELRNFAIAPDLRVRDVYPRVGNQELLGVSYLDLPDQLPRVLLARDSGAMVLDGPINLIQGGQGIVARLPVYVDGSTGSRFWGLVSSVLDFDIILDQLDARARELEVDIALRRLRPDLPPEPISGDQALFTDGPLEPQLLQILGLDWQITGVPSALWQRGSGLELPIGIAAVLVYAAILWLVDRSIRQSVAIREAEAEPGTVSSPTGARTEKPTGWRRTSVRDSAPRVKCLAILPCGKTLAHASWWNSFR